MAQDLSILDHVARAGLSNWDAKPFLQKVTDIVPNIIYVFNQKTQSNEYSNRSLGDSLGYSAEEVQAMGAEMLPKLCHPEDLPLIGQHFEALKRLSDGEVRRVEYRMMHKMGYWTWLQSYDTVFDRDGRGNVLRHIGVASDVSPQKYAEQQALAEKLKAETTNDELLAFSYSMSHDMRGPTNTLTLILTELLETHGAEMDADAVMLIEMARTTVGQMGILADEVLEYTKVVNQVLVPENLSITTIIEDILADLTVPIRKKKAIINFDDLPTVRADRIQMRTLLHNLIENALKFQTPGVPPQINITATENENDKSVAVTVQDNGLGIDPKKHEKVFTIFTRLNPGTDYPGTGLGLAICRRIAANHGGKISLVSRLGAGSAFTIGLPHA